MDRRGMSARRARRDSGASAVEYGLIIAGAGIVLVALSFATGKAVSGAFLTNATAVGGTPGVLGAADVGGVVAPTSAAPTTTSAAPTTSSAAPTTTSAAPTTTSAAPTTTSAAPTTTSAVPTTTAPPVQPSGTTAALRGSATAVDVRGNGSSRNHVATVSPAGAGTVTWASNGDLVFTPAAGATQYSLVTVTYAFTTNGNSRNGTVTFWLT